MPAARARHYGSITRRIELPVDLVCRCNKDFCFHLLAFAVLLIQFRREHCCFAFVLREQQSQRFLRRAQPPRRIQSRAKAVANIFGQDWRTNSGDLH